MTESFVRPFAGVGMTWHCGPVLVLSLLSRARISAAASSDVLMKHGSGTKSHLRGRKRFDRATQKNPSLKSWLLMVGTLRPQKSLLHS